MRVAAIHGMVVGGVLALTAASVAPATASPAPPSPEGAPGASGAPGAPGGLPGALSGTLDDVLSGVRAGPEARGAEKAARAAAGAGVDWKKCPPAEKLPAPVRCGTVSVPVDYAEPDGEKIKLTVSRTAATGPKGKRQGPLLYNPGGPGGNGMTFPLFGAGIGGVWKKLHESYDFVGYAPRGVGRSAPLSCQDPKKFTKGPSDSPRHPSAAYKRKMRGKAAAYASGCARAQGDRLRHYTTPDNARDLDVVRAALGAKKLNFFGVSYGTYIGSVYATLFPSHVRRLVLDSVVDPRAEKVWYRANLEQNPAFERRWNDWKKWVASHHSVYRLGKSPRAVQRAYDAVRDAADRSPLGGRIGSKELYEAYLDVGYDDSVWAGHASALSAFRKGKPKELLALASSSSDKEAAAEEENGNAVYNAVQCSDAAWPRDWSRWDRDNTALARKAPFNTWENAWMNLPCAYWRTAHARPLDVRTAPGELPPVLLLAATRDAATPYGGAQETHRRLAGSSLVTERGAGTHGVTGGNKCADAHLRTYLLEGKTPGDGAECAGRPAPEPVAGAKAAKRTRAGSPEK
ncbi:alpha/beta hydrolase [Streptomyces sp. NPDC054796]